MIPSAVQPNRHRRPAAALPFAAGSIMLATRLDPGRDDGSGDRASAGPDAPKEPDMIHVNPARIRLLRTPLRFMVSTTILVIVIALLTLVLLQLVTGPGHLLAPSPTPTIGIPGIPIPRIK